MDRAINHSLVASGLREAARWHLLHLAGALAAAGKAVPAISLGSVSAPAEQFRRTVLPRIDRSLHPTVEAHLPGLHARRGQLEEALRAAGKRIAASAARFS